MKWNLQASRELRPLPGTMDPPSPVQSLLLATAALGASNYAALGLFALSPLIRQTLGAGAATHIGLLTSLQFVTAALCVLPAARLTDAVDHRTVVAVSQIVAAVGMLVAAAEGTTSGIVAASLLCGASMGLVNPVANVLSIGTTPIRRRGLAMSIKQAGATAAGSLAALTLPPLAEIVGWRLACVAPAVVSVVVAGSSMSTRRRLSPRRPLVLAPISEHAVSRPRLSAFGFAMNGIQATVFGFLVLFLVQARGSSPTAAGFALALVLACGGAGRLAWGMASDNWSSRTPPLVLAASGSALALALLPTSSHTILLCVLAMVGLCSTGWNGVFNIAVAEAADSKGVARSTALVFLFLSAGSIIFPFCLGSLMGVISWRMFWWIGSGCAALAAVSLCASSRANLSKAKPTLI